jgi:2-polyprenyl-6-methoxyphenol hydroxylase-like FAD-dependent oxidoreductase
LADADVLIVGAGPGGLTLGLMLSRAGITVAVLEQSADFAREFRGDGLLPGGMRILADLGLREQVRALEHASPLVARVWLGDREIAYDSPPLRLADGSPALTSIPQRRLLELLATQAADSESFRLYFGVAVRELIVEGDRVAGVRDAAREWRAPLVVGFDGRFSAVRRSAGIDLVAHRVDFDIAWASVRRPQGEARYEAVVRGRDVCFWYPVGETMRIGVLIPKGRYQALRDAGFERFKTQLRDRVADPLKAPVEGLRGWEDITLLPAVSEMAASWRRPGMMLLGDAAHPMSPVAAQGINVALQDAAVAARYLVPALTPPRADAIDEALKEIERQRRPAVERIVRQQNILPRLMWALGPELAIRLAARLVLPVARSRFRPAFARRAIDRFLWGDPPVRAHMGISHPGEAAP